MTNSNKKEKLWSWMTIYSKINCVPFTFVSDRIFNGYRLFPLCEKKKREEKRKEKKRATSLKFNWFKKAKEMKKIYSYRYYYDHLRFKNFIILQRNNENGFIYVIWMHEKNKNKRKQVKNSAKQKSKTKNTPANAQGERAKEMKWTRLREGGKKANTTLLMTRPRAK